MAIITCDMVQIMNGRLVSVSIVFDLNGLTDIIEIGELLLRWCRLQHCHHARCLPEQQYVQRRAKAIKEKGRKAKLDNVKARAQWCHFRDVGKTTLELSQHSIVWKGAARTNLAWLRSEALRRGRGRPIPQREGKLQDVRESQSQSTPAAAVKSFCDPQAPSSAYRLAGCLLFRSGERRPQDRPRSLILVGTWLAKRQISKM